ncbi:MAG: carboxypeptidase regulatory-like domain-containing protein [Desulfobulbaceae bacterium]|nr:carboxypeptidase regulatory-like domain-containing protein [Desulfobulbaceae bacterium]
MRLPTCKRQSIQNAASRETGTPNKWVILPFIFILYLITYFNNCAQAGIIEGVIFSEHGPVQDGRVFAYSNYDDLVNNHEISRSEPVNKTGQYILQLEPGNYYLIARAEENGLRLFSYHGVNPVTVSNDYRWLPFLLTEETSTHCTNATQQGISGHVSYKGQPVSGGVISVYPWQEGKFRGMGLLTNTLDENGSFYFPLEPGRYVVVARKKQDIRGIGPVKQGDMFCYPSANPISVASSQLCSIQINCYPRDTLDLFLSENAINPQGRKHDTRRQASLYDAQLSEAPPSLSTRQTILSGQVTDQTGKPHAGLTITAYPANGQELFQMHILRLISESMGYSDKEGRFSIDLKIGGNYYIVAREKVGEAPDRGEYYGLYEGSSNHSINIKTGENITGIDLVVAPIMPKFAADHDQSNK